MANRYYLKKVNIEKIGGKVTKSQPQISLSIKRPSGSVRPTSSKGVAIAPSEKITAASAKSSSKAIAKTSTPKQSTIASSQKKVEVGVTVEEPMFPDPIPLPPGTKPVTPAILQGSTTKAAKEEDKGIFAYPSSIYLNRMTDGSTTFYTTEYKIKLRNEGNHAMSWKIMTLKTKPTRCAVNPNHGVIYVGDETMLTFTSPYLYETKETEACFILVTGPLHYIHVGPTENVTDMLETREYTTKNLTIKWEV